MKNEQNKKNINQEELKNVNGGWGYSSSLLPLCNYCGKQIYTNDHVKIGKKYCCSKCWEKRDELGIKGSYETDNGADGSW